MDDGARPGQLSVPWVMGQEILVRETGSPRTSSSNIRGLAGFRDSSDNTVDCRVTERRAERERRENTRHDRFRFAGAERLCRRNSCVHSPDKKVRGLEVRIFDDGSSSLPRLLHTQAPTAHGSRYEIFVLIITDNSSAGGVVRQHEATSTDRVCSYEIYSTTPSLTPAVK